MRALLAEPDMQALIAKAPVPLGRVLRRLCYMLQIDSKGLLPPPTRRRSAAQVAEAETASAEPQRLVRTRAATPPRNPPQGEGEQKGSPLPLRDGVGGGVEYRATPAKIVLRPKPDFPLAEDDYRKA